MPTVLITDSDFPNADIEHETLNEIGATVEIAQATTADEVVDAAQSVDADALYEAVMENRIGGAALDVLPREPPKNTVLADHEDIVVTPHMAWYSEESFDTLRRTVAGDVARLLSGDDPEHPVNEV